MKLINIISIWILGSLFLIICNSCNNLKNIEIKFLNSVIENYLEIDNTKKWILILPGVGCTGCIQEAETFVKENVDNNEVIIILTKISSLKILQHKLQININDYSNIYIDKENIFDIPTENSIYPCLVKINNGSVVSYEFQSPGNGKAFHELKSQI